MAAVDTPRVRRTFARLNKPLDVPNLIDIQRRSFDWLVDPEKGGLRETIDDISPIEDYTGHLAVQFGEFHFDEPAASIDECREKDLTYSRPLTVTVAFINHETGEIREQSVFMGDFPWMTERGTFIINGTERVVVTQLVRSPGAYLMEPKDREKQVFTANLMPARGSWLELEIDKKGKVFVRIDRKRKLPVTVLLRAMAYDPAADAEREETEEDVARLDEELARPLRQLALHPQHDRVRPRGDQDQEGRADRALQEAAPRRAAERRRRLRAAAAAVLRSQALRPHAGRPLQAQQPPEPRHRPGHARAHARRHPRARQGARLAAQAARHARGARRRDQGLRRRGRLDAARARRRAPRRVRALRQPPPAHRRRAHPGGLPHRPLPDGARRPRAADHRGRGHDHAADDRQHPPGRRRAEGVLRLLAAVAVHGPDQLAGRPDAPPAPERPRRGRPDPRARPHRGARRPPDPLRPDVPDRDAGGPEHRLDRLAVELRRDLRARLRHHALPGGARRPRHRRDRPPRRHAGRGAARRPGQRARSTRRPASSRAPRSSAAPSPASTSRSAPRTST